MFSYAKEGICKSINIYNLNKMNQIISKSLYFVECTPNYNFNKYEWKVFMRKTVYSIIITVC